jgi:5-methylcytosine-specific restriction endonuclease McrA
MKVVVMEDMWGEIDTRPRVIERDRDKYLWERLARRYKEYCRIRNLPCHLCIRRGDIENAAIDYSAKPNTAWAFEPDHIKPRSTHPELRLVQGNLAPSHVRCNRQRGDRSLNLEARQPDWVKPDW